MNGWEKRSERYYRGRFAGAQVRLLCPDTPGKPGQHNAWHLGVDICDEEPFVLGYWGIDEDTLLRRATTTTMACLRRCMEAIAEHGGVVHPRQD